VPATGGAEIREILPNSAASKGGLKPGDIILGFDGKQVLSPKDLEGLIKEFYREYGEKKLENPHLEPKAVLRIMRGIDETDVNLALGPDPEKAPE
jgi:S1-C subfamily serine protease